MDYQNLQVQTNKKAVETQKSDYIETPNPGDLKFRHIVVGPSCPTNRLGKRRHFITTFLNRIESYIRDSIYFF